MRHATVQGRAVRYGGLLALVVTLILGGMPSSVVYAGGPGEEVYLVKDVNTHTFGSDPEILTAVDGALFFSVDDGIRGYELWKSDGTAAGTVLVKDI